MFRRAALLCGILSSLLYAAMNVLVPLQWPGYSLAAHTVSELSAIGAPTRPLWVTLGTVYTLLLATFGWGVRVSAGHNRPLQHAGSTLMVYGALGLAWPPMHQRPVLAAGGHTLTDTLHIVFTMVTIAMMLIAMWWGAAALGPPFRGYTAATAVLLLLAGSIAGLDAPRLEAGLPTPWVGVWERVSIGAFLVWIIALACLLGARVGPAPADARAASREFSPRAD